MMALSGASNPISPPPWRAPSPSVSDCDSGAFSRCSTPGLSYNSRESPLLSPPLVLSVIKKKNQPESQKSKIYVINPQLLLSCLNEAGKSSKFSSLQNLSNHNHKSTKCHIPLTGVSQVLGSLPDIHDGRVGGCVRPDSSLSWWWDNEFVWSDTQQDSRQEKWRQRRTRTCEKNCNNQVTVNGQHLCTFS